MAHRRLSLHPSALSDAEHALFTASLADLAEVPHSTIDWDQVSVSVREARAWLCGRYAALGAGTVDEILRLFAPATALVGGAFFAALRLIQHAQAGRPVDRGLAFIQAPTATAISASAPRYNPFLPTPAPSPEARTRPPLPPRKPPAFSQSPSTSSASSASASSASSAPAPRRHHASLSGSSSPVLPLFSPPTHPQRRASMKTAPSTNIAPAPASPSPQSHNPFTADRRPPPLPRRASTSVPASPFQSNSPSQSAFHPSPSPSTRYPASADARTPSFAAADARAPSFAGAPPVHPHRRTTSYSHAHAQTAFDAIYGAHGRAVSDSPSLHAHSAPSSRIRERDREHEKERTPLALPRALRRTLAGAGWVGAERSEREGLVRYTSRGAGGRERGGDSREEGEGEAWGPL